MLEDQDEVTLLIETDEDNRCVILTVTAPQTMTGDEYLACLADFYNSYKEKPDSLFSTMDVIDTSITH